MFVYSIYDKVAGVFNTPFFQVNDGVAIRSFMDLVRDEKSSVCRHPEDYELWLIGKFLDDCGRIIEELEDSDGKVIKHFNKRLCSGLNFVRKEAEHANS